MVEYKKLIIINHPFRYKLVISDIEKSEGTDYITKLKVGYPLVSNIILIFKNITTYRKYFSLRKKEVNNMTKSYATHIEIGVTDLTKAKKFYGKVFGWNDEGVMQQWDENYILVNLDEGQSSFGLYKVDVAPQDNKIVITMSVDDIDAKLKEVENAGGKTTRERYEIDPEIGFGGNFKDPFGNAWGVHSPPSK